MTAGDGTDLKLSDTVISILTPPVTRSLPTAWQGVYTLKRAREWIQDRDREGITLLVLNRLSKEPIGLLILSEDENRDVRIGYLLAESAWGKGYASELIHGFIDWCKASGIRSITGGVAHDNAASIRVLEKNGFICEDIAEGKSEVFFTLQLEVG